MIPPSVLAKTCLFLAVLGKGIVSHSQQSPMVSRPPEPAHRAARVNFPSTGRSRPQMPGRKLTGDASSNITRSALPNVFEANQGQVRDSRVKFISRGKDYRVLLTLQDVAFVLEKKAPKHKRGDASCPAGNSPTDEFKIVFAGAKQRADIAVEGEGELLARSNYFRGKDPANWYTGIRNFTKVKYAELYEGIDLVFHHERGTLEYDFLVKPQADPKKIRLRFTGAQRVRLNRRGDLVLTTPGGPVSFLRPAAYQAKNKGTEQNGEPAKDVIDVHARFVLQGNNEVSFAVDAYDRRRTLIIDPAFVYSTYLGGTGGDDARSVKVDQAGNLYVTGSTSSVDFPESDPLQGSYGGGFSDAFVSKFSPDGSALLYSTYLGGTDTDVGIGLVVDNSGNVFVTGISASANFPTTDGAFQRTLKAINGNAFVAKLNSDGSQLLYSTFLGGTQQDFGNALAIDNAGNAYVAGSTFSSDFPTLNPFQAMKKGVGRTAFISKLNSSGSALVFSTYLGGSAGIDDIFGIAVDGASNVYVTGGTFSADFPTKNAFQSTNKNHNGTGNAFIAKLNANGSTLIYSTFLGGSGTGTLGDSAHAIAVDSQGNAYVAGQAVSSNFPTVNAFQPAKSGDPEVIDAFVSKLNADGTSLVFSSYLGGTSQDAGTAIALDAAGDIYVAGDTFSADFPVRHALQLESGGPILGSAFVTKLLSSGTVMPYSTRLGGSFTGVGHDGAAAVTVDVDGNAYVAGATFSANFPIYKALQTTHHGLATQRSNVFVTKISPRFPLVSPSPARLVFANQSNNTTSAPQNIAITNSGDVSLIIFSLSVSGEFALQSSCGTLPKILDPGDSCIVAIVFNPTMSGSHAGRLSISDTATENGHQVPLFGTGFAAGVNEITTTTVVSSLNPVFFRNFGTITATVSSTGTPTGTVVLFDGDTILAAAPLAAGIAVFNNIHIPFGNRPLLAAYSGDATFQGSFSSVLEVRSTPAPKPIP